MSRSVGWRHRALQKRDRSGGVRKTFEELVERDRVISYPDAGGIIDGIGHCRRNAAYAELGNALGLHRGRNRVGLIKEDDFLVRDIGVHRHLVAGEIMIGEET